MLKDGLRYKLQSTLDTCQTHLQRLQYARDYLADTFPLTIAGLENLNEEQISHCDQLVFRFARLQDTMGRRLFPLVMEALGEDIEGLPLIDVLSSLEKLKILESQKWLQLREIRNLVSHEYPDSLQERSEGLNVLNKQSTYLNTVLVAIRSILQTRSLID